MNEEQKEILREVQLQNLKKKPKLSKKTANSFNFQACLLPVIYNSVYNRRKLAAAFLILTAVPHIIDSFVSDGTYLVTVISVSILAIILALYSGLTGNLKAYDSRKYDDEIDFKKSQRFWIPAAIIALIIHICILPSQYRGHYNTIQMIKLAEAKDELKGAIQRGADEGNLLGVNTLEGNIPAYFAKYLNKGSFDGIDTITMPNGETYKIEGYLYECGSVEFNTYHEQKTACASVTIDLNGEKGPNIRTDINDVEAVKRIRTAKLPDMFTLYAYNNDLAPKEGSVEQYALKRFERK